MPLESGKSRETIATNIREMEASGHPAKVAVAAALHNAYDAHAAGILLTHGDRALFLKRSGDAKAHPGEWCCPGGSIEAGETPEQAAQRELTEETGLISGDFNRIDEGDGFVTFRQNVDAETDPTLNEEHSEAVWASLNDPPQPLHPGVAATIKKLLSGAALDSLAESFRGKPFTSALDKRVYDDNGWYTVLDNPLSTVGVYKYSGRSIGGDADPNTLYGVYRSAEELGNPETVDSFRLQPWTDDHPESLLGAKERGLVPAEEKGVHGVIGEQTYFRDGTLYGNVKVWSEALARDIASGKRELSCGYHCKFVRQDGIWNGEPYQYMQIGIRGNHLSSVDHGRMGARVSVQDAAEHFTFALDMKEHATVVAGASDAEKVTPDPHLTDGVTDMAEEIKIVKGTEGVGSGAGDGETKDPQGKKDDPKGELKAASKDRAAARDARDAVRAKDEMTSEEEEGMDASESAEDAEEEKEDKDDDSKAARDRKSARDRRAGARDQRAADRARDAEEDKKAKEAKDKEEAMKGKGMDAAEVAALVDRRVAAQVADVIPSMRREAAAKHKLYGRLSPVIGAFDHDEMTLVDMASYGLQKLDAPKASDPVSALDYLLVGRSQAQQPVKPRGALDKSEGSAVSRYLNS